MHMHQQHVGASVVICCHNSAARIRPTIEHLAKQQTRHAWEVIVVDNACTDDTAAIAEQTWREQGAPTRLRVVAEDRLGLSFARERGVRESEYEYVIFCDDDNWLAPDYVQLAVEIMETHPEVGALGGVCLPTSDVELPAWFWTYANSYAVGAQALESGDITARRCVWGAGMVLRRSVYLALLSHGARPLLTDRYGTQLFTGGDGEISKWFILAGYRLWYDERLGLIHFISPERLTKEYCRRLRAGNIPANRLIMPYQFVLDAAMTKSVWRRCLRLLQGLARSCIGDRSGLSILQAYHPLPSLTIEQTTRSIQVLSWRIRNGDCSLPSNPPPESVMANSEVNAQEP